MDLRPGDVVGDRFVIEGLAGVGGMGAVYRASDRTRPGTPVAIKVVLDGSDLEMARFAREARALEDFDDEAIVRYVAGGISTGGLPFLAMEWLEGEDLAKRLTRESLSISESVTLAARVARALAAAHARGVIHRDVKPSNILLVSADAARATLVDFGLARWTTHGAEATIARPLTATGKILGTIGYMAPEQVSGQRDLDTQVDVFALGAVLYECLTGARAFTGESLPAILLKILHVQPRPPCSVRGDIPEPLGELVMSMLAKDRLERPSTIDVARRLEAFAAAPGLPMSRPIRANLAAGSQRVVSVLLVACDEAAAEAKSVLTRLAGSPSVLADGTILATFSSTGEAKSEVFRAASSALEMKERITAARVAIATGRMTSGEDGIAGPIVDRVAALLAGATPDDGVLVDDVTASLVDSHFEVDRGDGGARLVREMKEATLPRTVLGRVTPFVGREKELALLEATVAESLEDEVARVALVTAPPGAGKSRLRQEVTLRARQRGLRVVFARGEPLSAGSPLTLARQLARSALSGVPPRERVSALFSGGVAVRVAELLSEILGAPVSSPESDQLRAARNNPRIMAEWLRASFVEWLSAEVAQGPLLVVLEDLHWGDLTTVTYFEEILATCKERPLVILATARPEIDERFANLWARAEPIRIRLGGLTKRAAEKLVRAIAPDAAPDVIARVIERADGNAFYLEELVRQIAQRESAELPDTILAVAHARLESLSPELRRVLRLASVFGESFWAGAVATLVAHAAESRAWLEELVDRELVERAATSRFDGEHEYVFRHGLIRDAAYMTLLEQDRVEAHRLAGEWLERSGEKDAALIGGHYELAGERERARAWVVRAARAAFDANNVSRAFPLAERGLALGVEGEDRGFLLGLRALGLSTADRQNEAGALLREALDLIEPGSLAWFLAAGLALVQSVQSKDLSTAAKLVGELLGLPVDPEPTGPYAIATYTMMAGLLQMNAVEPALLLWERIDRVAHRGSLDPAFVGWHRICHVFAVAAEQGPLDQTRRICEEGLHVLEGVGDSLGALLAKYLLASTCCEIGQFERAAEHARESRQRFGERGAQSYASWAAVLESVALLHLERYEAMVEVLEPYKESSDHEMVDVMLAYRALALGELDEVDRLARPVLTPGMPSPVGTLGAVALAHAECRRGRADAARTILDATIPCAVARLPSFFIYFDSARAEVAAALGDYEMARASVEAMRGLIVKQTAAMTDDEVRRTFIERYRPTLQRADEILASFPEAAGCTS